MSIASDIQKLDPGSLVELFTLDATVLSGGVFNFHAGINELGGDVVWQGVTYSRFPLEADGFELRANGTAPRPKIRASNIGGALGAVARTANDLIGSKITRRRTFVRYLDAVNFASGNPSADPNVHFTNDVFYVDRKSVENRSIIEWELVSAMDLVNAKIPKRQIIANVCPWQYRSSECNYTGGAVATASDTLTGDISKDVCGKRLASCKLRFGTYAVLPFGGFPAAALVRA